MLCFGIESSCDDTCIALVHNGVKIKHVYASQARLHALYGGVVPEIASRHHAQVLPKLTEELFAETPYSWEDVELFAVTRGPGLLGSLLVGLAFAKGLACSLQKPLIGVHHLHAHLLGIGLEETFTLPAIGILLSGGHSYIYYIKGFNSFHVLGKTIDDAAGEVFDKVGKMLSLPYPAGKYIDALAQEYSPHTTEHATVLTPPYCTSSLDFSFSGLKTQALRAIAHNTAPLFLDEEKKIPSPYMQQICYAMCTAVATSVRKKLENAFIYCNEHKMPIRSILFGGGVAANSFIRNTVCEMAYNYAIPAHIPSPQLCADNALMVAYTGSMLHTHYGYYHPLSLSAIPRGQIVPLDYCTQ